MLLLELFYEFFKIGLFAVGGGPATLPYLIDLAEKRPWYTIAQLTNMIAISESTPGPIGLNMSTYAGFQTAGIMGGLSSTIGLVVPSLIIIILVAKFLENFNKNKYVQAAFKGIRPAVTGLIAAAVANLFQVSLYTEVNGENVLAIGSAIIGAVIFGLLQIKSLKKFHPVVWFLIGAIIGILFRL